MDEEFQRYTNNLSSYIRALTPSNVRFLYFCHNERTIPKNTAKFIAYVNSCAYKFDVPSSISVDPLYIVPSKNAEFCYMYKDTDINVEIELGRHQPVQTRLLGLVMVYG